MESRQIPKPYSWRANLAQAVRALTKAGKAYSYSGPAYRGIKAEGHLKRWGLGLVRTV